MKRKSAAAVFEEVKNYLHDTIDKTYPCVLAVNANSVSMTNMIVKHWFEVPYDESSTTGEIQIPTPTDEMCDHNIYIFYVWDYKHNVFAGGIWRGKSRDGRVVYLEVVDDHNKYYYVSSENALNIVSEAFNFAEELPMKIFMAVNTSTDNDRVDLSKIQRKKRENTPIENIATISKEFGGRIWSKFVNWLSTE